MAMPSPVGPQLPIRLTAEQDRRLKAIAQRTGASKSSLIRLLIDTFLTQCVQPDGSTTFPPNWKSLLSPADGRSTPSPRQQAAITHIESALRVADDSAPDESAAERQPVKYKAPRKKKSQGT